MILTTNSMNVRHLNNGSCPKCEEIINKYKDFNSDIYNWFKSLQKLNMEVHTSCAGRGKADQEDAFKRGASKAKYGESAHNFGLAIDLFKIDANGKAEWSIKFYREVINPAVKMSCLLEHGLDWKKFVDAPHVELKNWKELVKQGKAKLVE